MTEPTMTVLAKVCSAYGCTVTHLVAQAEAVARETARGPTN
ncbi:hypothetical protein [Streptomyces swartbergensis]|nr:hypothetical protein [Streptomyces swartbergensis]